MMYLTVTGNIGKDAVVKNTNGKNYVTFSVADTRRWKDNQGQDKEATTWISCIMAETGVRPFLKKGTKVLLMGTPAIQLWQDQNRHWNAGINLNVEKIELLSPKKEETEAAASGKQYTELSPEYAEENNSDSGDLPF
jgi:single-strand DNA-binding protein